VAVHLKGEQFVEVSDAFLHLGDSVLPVRPFLG